MAKAPANVTVTYTGGMDQVDVTFPSGNTIRVRPGESAEVFPADAATLSRDEWSGDGVGTAFDEPEVVVPTPQPEADPQ